MVGKALSAILAVLLCSAASTQTPVDNYGSISSLPVLSRYEKISTQQNGGGLEAAVSYYFVNGTETNVLLNMRNSRQINSPIDYTIMFWFKLGEFTAELGSPMSLFYIKDFLSCSIDVMQTVICKGGGVDTIQVLLDQLAVNKWIHLTISISATNQQSYLMISDNFGSLNSTSQIGFWVQQTSTQLSDWSICFGGCSNSENGFVGGIREVVARNAFIDMEKALLDQNVILGYSADITAYYRILEDPQRFDQDQFLVQRTNKKLSQQSNQMQFKNIKLDLIPPNVCPQNFDYQEFYRFSFQQIRVPASSVKQELQTINLTLEMDQMDYTYSMQLSIYINTTSCQTTNVQTAKNGCNLVYLEGVFLLYFESQNYLRFHYFAKESYYETQSSRFFVPYNTWISIQMTMGRVQGYQIYVLDQNYATIQFLAQQYNLTRQEPVKKLHLFSSLVGYVNEFVLANVLQVLPVTVFQLKNPAIKFNFQTQIDSNEQLLSKIKNQGTVPSTAEFKYEPESDQVLFTPFKIAQKQVQRANFDGLSCNDGHLAVKLTDSNSYISFLLPPFKLRADFSFQFWFKLIDSSQYIQSRNIFSIYDSTQDMTYWQVQIGQNGLKIAPFGRISSNSPVLYFRQFSLQNEDEFGWWFLSCAYQFQEQIECHLQNSDPNIDYVQIVNIKQNRAILINQDLQGFIGYNKNSIAGVSSLAVKEFRMWEKFISSDEVKFSKQQQVVPEDMENLLVYLKLNSANRPLFNFIFTKPGWSQFLQGSFSGLTDYQDFLIKNELQFSVETQKISNVTYKSFHPVCPQYTYLMGDRCFENPINDLIISIFPLWNHNSSSLDWIITAQHSSLINSDAFRFLYFDLSSDDLLLESQFKQQLKDNNSFTFTIKQEYLRNENLYQLNAYFKNGLNTVSEQTGVSFIPNKCQWFEIEGFNSSVGNQIFTNPPGQDDINFQIVLRKSSDPACRFPSFYDAFSQISFKFFETNTDEKIAVQPQVQYLLTSDASKCQKVPKGSSIFLPSDNNCSDNLTVEKAEDLVIQITISSDQLVQMPIDKEVKLLMTIGWTSSSFFDLLENDFVESTVFQNVLYTFIYSPGADVSIEINLDQSIQNFTRGQTLTIDASNITTKNYPQNRPIPDIFYLWDCPYEFQEYCNDLSILQINWDQIKSIENIKFNQQYRFFVTAALVRNNKIRQINRAETQVMLFDTVIPDFDISFDPSPISSTSDKNTKFYISPNNFNAEDLNQFRLEWNATESILESANFENGGEILLIQQELLQPNQTYFVSLTLTYYYADWITNTTFLQFKTGQGGPYGGNYTISPQQGNIGEEFTIQIAGWNSHQPLGTIFYNVYESLDSNGQGTGIQLNQQRISADQSFTWQINSTYPIIVLVQDEIGEQTVIVVFTNVTNAPKSTDKENEEEGPSNSTQSNVIEPNQSPNSDNSKETIVDQSNANQNADISENSQNQPDQDLNQTESNEISQDQPDANQNQTESNELVPSETLDIQGSNDNFSFSNSTNPSVDAGDQFADASAGDSFVKIFKNAEHKNVSKAAGKISKIQQNPKAIESSILANLQNNFKSSATLNTNHNQKLSVLNNITQNETLSTIKQSSDSVKSNKSQAAKNCDSLFNEMLNKIQKTKVCNVNSSRNISADLLSFLVVQKCSPESALVLNKQFTSLLKICKQDMQKAFVILDNTAQIAIDQMNKSLAKLVLTQVRSLDQPESFTGENIQVNSFRIWLDRPSIIQNITLRALDTTYKPDSRIVNDLLSFGITNEFLYLQLIAVRSSLSTQFAVVHVYEPQSQTVVQLQQLSGQIIVNFDILPEYYKSNVTICQVNSDQEDLNKIQSCLTDLKIEKQQLQCTCNVMISGDSISLVDDFSRQPGLKVFFPQNQSNVVQSLTKMNETSYFYLVVITLLFSYGLCGTCLAFKLDKQFKSRIGQQAIKSAEDISLTKKISEQLNQQIQIVDLKLQNFKTYKFAQLPVSVFILAAIHPFISPFTSHQADLTRLFRFCTYLIQVNSVFIAALVYFGHFYRNQDKRMDTILDQTDIIQIGRFITVGSVALLPIFSEMAAYFCKQNLEFREKEGIVFKSKFIQNVFLIFTSVTLNIAASLYAITTLRSISLSNQYLISCSMFGIIITAGVGTNMVRVLINSFVFSWPLNLLQNNQAREILRDFELVHQLNFYKEEDSPIELETVRSNQTLQTEEAFRKVEETIEISGQKVDLGFEISLKLDVNKSNM